MREGRSRSTLILLGLILAAATILRSIGLGFGLPAIYNPDEVAIMNRALALGQNGFNPHNFLYPSLYFYALFAWEGAWFALGYVLGVFDSVASFERFFFVDPSSIYLAGRILSVVCGVATVWATWRLGARLFGRIAGLSAAAMLAVAPLAVRDAHYVKHDVPVTLLIVLAHLLLAGRRSEDRIRQHWILTGIVTGLALSTHYYAVFLLLPVMFVVMTPEYAGEPVHPRLRRLAITAIAVAVAFFAGSPFLLVEPFTAVRDIVANREIVVDRVTDSTGMLGSLGFYLRWLARDAAGATTAALALAGAVTAWRAGWTRWVLVLAFPVAFLLFIGNTYPASRYLNPILPFVALLAGAAIASVSSGRGISKGLAMTALTAALVEGALASSQTDLFFRQTDTRTQALEWIERTLPAGTSVLVQPYSVPLRPSRDGLVEALTRHLGAPERASVKFQRQLALVPYPAPAYRTIYLGSGGLDVDKIYVDPAEFSASAGLEPLRRLSVTHLILKRYNEPDRALAPLTAALEREGHLLAAFSPYRTGLDPARLQRTAPFLHNTDARVDSALERPGPIIEIWTTD